MINYQTIKRTIHYYNEGTLLSIYAIMRLFEYASLPEHGPMDTTKSRNTGEKIDKSPILDNWLLQSPRLQSDGAIGKLRKTAIGFIAIIISEILLLETSFTCLNLLTFK